MIVFDISSASLKLLYGSHVRSRVIRSATR
jgi:hypothetical protein